MLARVTTLLAIDIGGTKMAAGLVTDDGSVLVHDRVPTPTAHDAEAVWGGLTELVDRLVARAAPPYDGIGVGCGGPMIWPEGLVSPLHIAGWRDFPLLDRVRERWADGRPVATHNDAVAL